MDFAFNDDQQELRRYAASWLEDKSPIELVRELMDTPAGWSPESWADIAGMGWQSIAIPEEYGGAGFGFLEVAVLLEEQGASLFPGPYLSTVVLGANALLLAGSDQQRNELLPRIAAGELTLTVAASDLSGDLTPDDTETRARREGDTWILEGKKRFVLDGHTADKLIVTARSSHGIRAFLVDRMDVMPVQLPVLDQTRRLAEVTLEGVRISTESELPGDAESMLERLRRIASVAIALESVGGAQRCLDMAVAYAKDRHQFGRPIGSFQAIKHKCAEMLVQLEAARSAAYYAAWTVAASSDELAEAAAVAKAYCTDAFFHCASENIQIHGGIGFTWEHDAHLYFKRAKSSQLIFGSPQEHRRRLASVIGVG